MDALALIRSAAEFADELERDVQHAAERQMQRVLEEIRSRSDALREREVTIARREEESRRQQALLLREAREEAQDLLSQARRDALDATREGEARAERLIEHARHDGTELTNATRSEVERTLAWAHGQSEAITRRAKEAAGRLLVAAGHGPEAVDTTVEAIVEAARREGDPDRRTRGGPREAETPETGLNRDSGAHDSGPSSEPSR